MLMNKLIRIHSVFLLTCPKFVHSEFGNCGVIRLKPFCRYIPDTDETITDFFSVDFTWNELRQLRVNQRFESRYSSQFSVIM